MEFSNYVRRYRDLSPTFSTSNESATSITDSADSIASVVRRRRQRPRVLPSPSNCRMTTPYSRGPGIFPPRRLQDTDLGPDFNVSQMNSQPMYENQDAEANDDDFENFFVREEIPPARRTNSIAGFSGEGGPSSPRYMPEVEISPA
ncbi:hypothetical protein KC19_6G030200, partial [Ceratodon purpureus]